MSDIVCNMTRGVFANSLYRYFFQEVDAWIRSGRLSEHDDAHKISQNAYNKDVNTGSEE